jgi:hypothetical protein
MYLVGSPCGVRWSSLYVSAWDDDRTNSNFYLVDEDGTNPFPVQSSDIKNEITTDMWGYIYHFSYFFVLILPAPPRCWAPCLARHQWPPYASRAGPRVRRDDLSYRTSCPRPRGGGVLRWQRAQLVGRVYHGCSLSVERCTSYELDDDARHR